MKIYYRIKQKFCINDLRTKHMQSILNRYSSSEKPTKIYFKNVWGSWGSAFVVLVVEVPSRDDHRDPQGTRAVSPGGESPCPGCGWCCDASYPRASAPAINPSINHSSHICLKL